MTPEGKVKAKIDKLLKEYDVWFFKPRGSLLGRSGIPDYICLIKGKFFAIEAKACGREPTALQLAELRNITMHGAPAYIIREDNLEVLRTAIENFIKP